MKKIMLLLFLTQILSCTADENRSPRIRHQQAAIEIRNDFAKQLQLLSNELDEKSLTDDPKQSKKIVSSFLSSEIADIKLESAFENGFAKMNDYFRRSHFWMQEFDRKLNEQEETTEDSNSNYLESSLEYQMLEALRIQQQANIEEIIHEFSFLLKFYGGLDADGVSRDLSLEEKLKRSIVAAKFLVRLTEIEKLWRSEFPVVFDGLFKEMQETRELVAATLKENSNTDTHKKFNKAKAKILDVVVEIEFIEKSPIEGLSNREIELYQKNSSLEGERIEKLNFGEEISELEEQVRTEFLNNKSTEFRLNEVNNTAVKCLQPSMGPEGNITGSEFPKNHWALTFDDGPSSKYTNRVLEFLREEKVKVTFFLVAQKMNSAKTIIRSEVSEGHSIASHSWSHANLPKVSETTLDHEIIAPNAVHEAILKVRPKFYRCPYGAGFKNAPIRQRIVDQGMIHVFWNVDTLDWQDKNPDSIVQRALSQMAKQKRGVILFHDTHEQSVLASRALVKHFRQDTQIKWQTLPDAVALVNKGRGCFIN